MDAISVGPADL